ncbi:efflux RND transporter periplasmic adaptor subunit [Shewanella livingstonensis]|uniref:Efflux RND transporter periplasmic adaptor subunit n=1 Tax=Shewanella livingstonensis TaxID=150120 RepID=A0A3G8M0U0_9GAMM|nr:efflux RND transporter periplasmic adaptor subunit [Shewanella livingstonensis]AZG75267.1 efflux RND transporter periplasmic adaptor subunit [Shewanella livingstonensis]
MKNIKRLVTITLLVVATGAVAAYFYAKNDASTVAYSTEPVRIGNIEDVVLTNGVLYPSKMVNIGAQVSGKLESIAVSVGDRLEAGALIAQIDNLSQENALKEAQASLTSINAQYKAKVAQIHNSELSFERQKAMLEKNVTSQSLYDAAEAELIVYKSELDQLIAEKEKALINVDDAQLDLSYTTIESPIHGTVVYVSVEEGQTVNTNQSTPSIVEVAQLDVMTVKAQVSEADIIHVTTGQKVYFSILGAPQDYFNGELRTIEPGPTLLTGEDSKINIGDDDAIYYNAVFDVDNKEGLLRFGMTAQVSIVLDSAQDALLVPSQILTRKLPGDNRYRIPVLVDGALEMREVEIGIDNKVYAQVLSGLEQGDRVVMGQANTKSASSFNMRSTLGQEKGERGNGGPGKGGRS